jgi:hypothetical protein
MINDKDLEGSRGSRRNFPAGITQKQRKASLLMTGSLAEIRFKTSRRQVWRLTLNTNISKKKGVRLSVGIQIFVFAVA